MCKLSLIHICKPGVERLPGYGLLLGLNLLTERHGKAGQRAVSYTHLDVYKRQVLTVIQHSAPSGVMPEGAFVLHVV